MYNMAEMNDDLRLFMNCANRRSRAQSLKTKFKSKCNTKEQHKNKIKQSIQKFFKEIKISNKMIDSHLRTYKIPLKNLSDSFELISRSRTKLSQNSKSINLTN